ncbi:outer membrane-stress sensor serine endopeptidase DegS [Gallaecimonas sp. GXIMD4217]|uniref:outer membrane-stress sensor serine endopeptidase DegS n=1 Tax=Gallaecimonas sp. GXIMD4217 TaxID=3131927 RepID=UPI00311B1105
MPGLLKDTLKAVLFGLLIAALLLTLFPELRSPAQQRHSVFREEANLPALLSFSNAVRRAAPAVVNIYSLSIQSGTNLYSRQPNVRPEGLGSGVIMTPQGHVLTNYHVIDGADQIVVALQDGRVLFPELIGTDPATDLAVLAIDAENLPVIPQDASLQPQVGDVVLAIGNPYNIGQTITQGIVSATGRAGMSSTGYQDFLQTDAAINAGNSGGALVNSNGVLVGINTALFHINQRVEVPGISFAIPYQLAAKVLKQLVTQGRVIRGYLGVSYRFERSAVIVGDRGVEISAVEPGSPAQQAGILVGDLLVAINGERVRNGQHAKDVFAETRPGTRITVTVIRNRQPLQLPVIVGELPPRLP